METYLRKLANHANMIGEREPEAESLSWHLWQAEKTGVFPDLVLLRSDILQCLEEANVQVNGPVPSQKTGTSQHMPDWLSLYVCEIIRHCQIYELIWEQQTLFTPAERYLLKQTAWMIVQAWCYILHGDIDEIVAQVQSVGEISEIL